MCAARLAIEVQHRSIVGVVAAGRQRAGATSHRYQDKRKPTPEHRSNDHRQADARIRNRDSHSDGNQPQPANALNLNVRHVDQRR